MSSITLGESEDLMKLNEIKTRINSEKPQETLTSRNSISFDITIIILFFACSFVLLVQNKFSMKFNRYLIKN